MRDFGVFPRWDNEDCVNAEKLDAVGAGITVWHKSEDCCKNRGPVGFEPRHPGGGFKSLAHDAIELDGEQC